VITVFDATSKVKVFEKMHTSGCDTQHEEPVQVGFTNDNQYFNAKIECGLDNRKSVVVYTKFPEF